MPSSIQYLYITSAYFLFQARGELEESFTGNFHVIQPGSTVATSLVPGEAKQKQVVVLHIRGEKRERDVLDSEYDGLLHSHPFLTTRHLDLEIATFVFKVIYLH